MRTLRLLSVPTLAVTTVLTVGACTSEDPATETSTSGTDDAAVTSDDGLQGEVGGNGYLCQYVSPATADAAAGGTAVTPRGLVTEDDEDGWVCDVLSGGPGEQEPVLRLSIHLGEEARAEARARAEAEDGVEPGPEYLGLSFISPGLVTGLTSCTAPDATNRADQIPYTLVGESLTIIDEEMTDEVRSALALMAQNLDKSVGCAPKAALQAQS